MGKRFDKRDEFPFVNETGKLKSNFIKDEIQCANEDLLGILVNKLVKNGCLGSPVLFFHQPSSSNLL
jgi:hypothetical protein